MNAPRAAEQHPIEAAIRAVEEQFLLGVPGTSEVLLIRHGDCYDGLRVEDQDDPPLSALGRTQTQALAGRLAGTPLAAVYTSDLRRARETAAALGHDVVLDPRLQEAAIDWGEGMRFTETIAEVAVRVARTVDDAVARHPGQRIAMVSHGGAIMAYLSRLLKLEPPGLRLLPDFTSVSVVRAREQDRVVGSIADATHLKPAS
ncbi:MAG: histidine phosphatase family protein [Candidatus Dormibacteraceae bacterium]